MTAALSPNKQTVQLFLDAFGRFDLPILLECLTDDVEWIMPGCFHLHGKDSFFNEIDTAAYVGNPTIEVIRMTEENNLVIAEGRARSVRTDCGVQSGLFCDVFEMQAAKIRRLTSYLMDVPE